MATEGEEPLRPDEGEILPDEKAAIAARVESLEELDAEEFLSVSEVAEELDIE